MTWTQFDKDKYRFSAERYSLRGTNASQPSEYVPQLPGLYAFPAGDELITPSPESESSEETP